MLIDSHCHLPFNQAERNEVLNRAKENGVGRVISIGTNLANSEKTLQIAHQEETVFATVGVYPHEERDTPLQVIAQKLTDLAQRAPKVVAIGECGIDITNWANQRPIDEQIALFETQIEVALNTNLPVVIHNRNGDEQIFNSLRKCKGVHKNQLRGVAHCFAGSWETAQKFLDLGFFISFSGFITHTSKSWLAETVKNVPLDKFLVETDAPYILPKGVREPQNEPKNVKMVAQKIAQIKNLPFDQIAEISYKNTCTLFGLEG